MKKDDLAGLIIDLKFSTIEDERKVFKLVKKLLAVKLEEVERDLPKEKSMTFYGKDEDTLSIKFFHRGFNACRSRVKQILNKKEGI